MPWRRSPYVPAAAIALLLCLPGCGALNPLCGSARPTPSLSSLNPSTVTLGEVQAGTTITLSGSNFVASSVAVINNIQLASTVTNSTTIKATVDTKSVGGSGSYTVWVYTPAGNSEDLGCSSGGNSAKLPLTVD